MNIAIFSGEISGDLIGGALAQELRRLAPDIELWGIGSSAMRAAGVELVADSAEWGAISITESITRGVGILARMAPLLKQEVRRRKPDLLLLIDFGFFNVRAARFAHSLGIKVLYYFPPGAWRRSGDRERELASITDLCALPFTWSTERFQQMGINAVYVGHPLLERVRPAMTRAQFAAEFDMDPAAPIIGLLPGSRRHEVAHNLPAMLDAARLIARDVRGAQFVIGVASSLSPETIAGYLSGHRELRDRLAEHWHEFVQEAGTRVMKQVARTAAALAPPSERNLVTAAGVVVPENKLREELERQARAARRATTTLPPLVLAKGLTYDVMAHSDALVTCSGTATLEAAALGTPMVIIYRGSRIMELEYHLRGISKKITHIGLPNILAERRIVPELIQHEASPEAIAGELVPLLNNVKRRSEMKAGLAGVRALLGEEGASERTARLALELTGRASQ